MRMFLCKRNNDNNQESFFITEINILYQLSYRNQTNNAVCFYTDISIFFFSVRLFQNYFPKCCCYFYQSQKKWRLIKEFFYYDKSQKKMFHKYTECEEMIYKFPLICRFFHFSNVLSIPHEIQMMSCFKSSLCEN